MESRQDVELVQDARAALGEGPAWDAASGRLIWVDILGRRVHRLDPATGHDALVETPLDVGAAVPRRSGGLLLALQDGFWRQEGSGAPEPWVRVGEDASVRFNDGKCDPAGRLYAGTMGYDARPGAGAFYRLDPDGRVTPLLDGVTISNGLAWSADARTFFYIDSPLRRIDAFDVDPVTGALSRRRTVVDLSSVAGVPDGMAIDADGGLWVAFFGGGCVRRYDPDGGAATAEILLPARDVTSCAFGGPDLADLYITTARVAADAAELAARPLSGGLFRIRPGVRGTPTEAFAG